MRNLTKMTIGTILATTVLLPLSAGTASASCTGPLVEAEVNTGVVPPVITETVDGAVDAGQDVYTVLACNYMPVDVPQIFPEFSVN